MTDNVLEQAVKGWARTAPTRTTELSTDKASFGHFWQRSTELLARLPGKPRRNAEEAAAAAEILALARDSRTKFMRAHARGDGVSGAGAGRQGPGARVRNRAGREGRPGGRPGNFPVAGPERSTGGRAPVPRDAFAESRVAGAPRGIREGRKNQLRWRASGAQRQGCRPDDAKSAVPECGGRKHARGIRNRDRCRAARSAIRGLRAARRYRDAYQARGQAPLRRGHQSDAPLPGKNPVAVVPAPAPGTGQQALP